MQAGMQDGREKGESDHWLPVWQLLASLPVLHFADRFIIMPLKEDIMTPGDYVLVQQKQAVLSNGNLARWRHMSKNLS
jgi:hypothetical protein